MYVCFRTCMRVNMDAYMYVCACECMCLYRHACSRIRVNMTFKILQKHYTMNYVKYAYYIYYLRFIITINNKYS